MMVLKESIAYMELNKRNATRIISSVDDILNKVAPLLNQICIHFENYTLHDINHSLRVLDYMCKLIGDKINHFSNLEVGMIIYAALLHDIGMWVADDEIESIKKEEQYLFCLSKNNGNHKFALQDYVRTMHGIRAYQYLMSDSEIINLMQDTELSTVKYFEDIALICQSHMESIEWIDGNLRERFTKGQEYNSKYIALLLRIGDYLDFDSQRAPDYLHTHKSLGAISQDEWKKHAMVCNLDKIEKGSRQIYFDIECDDFRLYCRLMETFELINKEISTCVSYSKNFKEEKYQLLISEKIEINVVTKGFRSDRFYFSMDYYKVTNLLMGENLYGDKKYGLRELLQNSFDTCNLMYEINKRNNPIEEYNQQISIIYDYDQDLIIIKDNGTGMSQDIINKYFLTIGMSYYQSEDYEKQRYSFSPTGTFGIGFLSCFMLSNKVSVCSKYYENGEVSAFSLERDTKYICFKEKKFTGSHGTEIYLDMDEFSQIFTLSTLKKFIKNNFYKLDSVIKIFEKRNEKFELKNEVIDTELLKGLNIDLSEFFIGVECKASLSTFLDEFFLYDSYMNIKDGSDVYILISTTEIRVLEYEELCIFRSNPCNMLTTLASFEEIIMYSFDFIEYSDKFDDNIEMLEAFEKYGFDLFRREFNISKENFFSEDLRDSDGYIIDEYSDHEYADRYWSNSDAAMDLNRICVVWDSSFGKSQIQKILKDSQYRYFKENGMLRLIRNTSDDTEKYELLGTKLSSSYELGEMYNVDQTVNISTLAVKTCYRGVYLSDLELIIPTVANIFITIFVAVNAYSSDLVPSVTRRNLTMEQASSLSYAIGRAIHLYLAKINANDHLFCAAINKFIQKYYPTCNSLCKHYNE